MQKPFVDFFTSFLWSVFTCFSSYLQAYRLLRLLQFSNKAMEMAGDFGAGYSGGLVLGVPTASQHQFDVIVVGQRGCLMVVRVVSTFCLNLTAKGVAIPRTGRQ